MITVLQFLLNVTLYLQGTHTQTHTHTHARTHPVICCLTYMYHIIYVCVCDQSVNSLLHHAHSYPLRVCVFFRLLKSIYLYAGSTKVIPQLACPSCHIYKLLCILVHVEDVCLTKSRQTNKRSHERSHHNPDIWS